VELGQAISRDGQQCVWCGRAAWPDDLTLEHLLPKTRGGRGLPENLTLACRRCNRRRGAKPVIAYVREQLEAGQQPQMDLLRVVLERLSRSGSRPHAEYGGRQLELLGRIDGAGSADDGRLARDPLGIELG
jgi:hypothetical protein